MEPAAASATTTTTTTATEAPKKEEIKPPTDDDFQKVDIRVGRITECWKHPESENLYCEKIDIGSDQIRLIASGLQKF